MKAYQLIKVLGVAAVMSLSVVSEVNAMPVGDLHTANTMEQRVEPLVTATDAWAMIVVGLGLVGLRLRRKDNTKDTLSGKLR